MRRLAVFRHGRLVRIVSRAGLLRALLPNLTAETTATRSDGAIRIANSARMEEQAWANAPRLSCGDVVELQGYYKSSAARRAVSASHCGRPRHRAHCRQRSRGAAGQHVRLMRLHCGGAPVCLP